VDEPRYVFDFVLRRFGEVVLPTGASNASRPVLQRFLPLALAPFIISPRSLPIKSALQAGGKYSR